MHDIRRHWWGYTFRAWIDRDGSNAGRRHALHCVCSPEHRKTGTHYVGVHHCLHYRLWDANTKAGGNILRIVRRRRPFALDVAIGPRYRRLW